MNVREFYQFDYNADYAYNCWYLVKVTETNTGDYFISKTRTVREYGRVIENFFNRGKKSKPKSIPTTFVDKFKDAVLFKPNYKIEVMRMFNAGEQESTKSLMASEILDTFFKEYKLSNMHVIENRTTVLYIDGHFYFSQEHYRLASPKRVIQDVA